MPALRIHRREEILRGVALHGLDLRLVEPQDDLQKMQLIVNRMSELIKGQQAIEEAEGTDG